MLCAYDSELINSNLAEVSLIDYFKDTVHNESTPQRISNALHYISYQLSARTLLPVDELKKRCQGREWISISK